MLAEVAPSGASNSKICRLMSCTLAPFTTWFLCTTQLWGHGLGSHWRPPWLLQTAASRPRQRGLPEPPHAAPSGLCDVAKGCGLGTRSGPSYIQQVQPKLWYDVMLQEMAIHGKKMWTTLPCLFLQHVAKLSETRDRCIQRAKQT